MSLSTTVLNALGQPVGFPVPSWQPRAHPKPVQAEGRFCRLAPLDARDHTRDLFEALAADREGKTWTYLPYGPFPDLGKFEEWVTSMTSGEDPLFSAIIDLRQGKPAGVASLMRIDRLNGSIEVGHVIYSPALQRSPAATEAMYLFMKYAFELGYRRYEWKCDSLNAASRAAALRLGFSFEGIFRQALVVKGHNRDTAWFSILDREWPVVRRTFEKWLDPSNFDEQGRQRRRLVDLREEIAQPSQIKSL